MQPCPWENISSDIFTIVTHDCTTKSNEGSTPSNGIEAGKRTTKSNQGSNPRIRNPKSEIRNPQFE